MSGCSTAENGYEGVIFQRAAGFFAFETHTLVLPYLIKAGCCRRTPCIYLEAHGVSSYMASDFLWLRRTTNITNAPKLH